LSDDDRVAEENALACKYGLGAGAPPSAPGGLTSSAGNRQVSLNWMPTIGASSFNLRRATDSGGTFTSVATGITATNFVDTNAVSGQTNYYTLAAVSDCGVSSNSTLVSIFLSLPSLGVRLNANSLIISWPDWASDWVLSSATNLSPLVVWSPVTNSIGNTNGQFSVTLPLRKNVEFFHLKSP
jgi:hypothetical protein